MVTVVMLGIGKKRKGKIQLYSTVRVSASFDFTTGGVWAPVRAGF